MEDCESRKEREREPQFPRSCAFYVWSALVKNLKLEIVSPVPVLSCLECFQKKVGRVLSIFMHALIHCDHFQISIMS